MANDDLEAKRRQLRATAAKMLAGDHFALLGLTRTASVEDVKKAFLDAVKTWHPDRVPSGLDDLRPTFTEVFARLDQARTVLSDPSARLEYARVVAGEKAAAAVANEAALEFRKAEAFFKRNDLAAALGHIKRAMEVAPDNADYRAFAVAMEAGKTDLSQERLLAMVKELDGVVGKDAKCERALLTRGQLHKRLDHAAKAQADFQRVVELNPKNVDAAREVRLYEMRKERAGGGPAAGARASGSREKVGAPAEADEGAGIGGFFKKLFKK